MKHLLYIFLLATTVSYGQTGFIEVEVRDAIQLTPLEFEYNIRIHQSNFMKYDENGLYDAKTVREEVHTKSKELQSFLSTKGYIFRPLKSSNYEIESNPILASKGYIVTIKTTDQLKKLVDDLEKIEGISGVIGNTLYDERDTEKKLFAKLIKKATAKATMIADLSNLQLGKIIEFKEVKEIDNISFNIMDVYLTTRQKPWGMEKGQLYGQSMKAVVIKFSTQ